MSLPLQNSINEYEKKIERFMDINGPKMDVCSIDQLLVQLKNILTKLEEEDKVTKNRIDSLKIGDALLRYENDFWFFEELKKILSKPIDKGNLCSLACHNPKYALLVTKYKND